MSDATLEQQLTAAIAAELNARRVEAWNHQAIAMAEIRRIRDEIEKAGRQ